MLDLLYYIIIGLIAGWLAGRILKERSMGLFGNLVIGVVGAVVGAYIFEFFGISSGGLLGTLVSAVIGAVILLYVIQALRKVS
jgi:uncharacterized membrane protein YeaQ/YmgE (transglycosylase-associated protein family)